MKATHLTLAPEGFKFDEILTPVVEVYENNLEQQTGSVTLDSVSCDLTGTDLSFESTTTASHPNTPPASNPYTPTAVVPSTAEQQRVLNSRYVHRIKFFPKDGAKKAKKWPSRSQKFFEIDFQKIKDINVSKF